MKTTKGCVCHVCKAHQSAIGYYDQNGQFVKLSGSPAYNDAGEGINYYNRGKLTAQQGKAWLDALNTRPYPPYYTYIRLKKYKIGVTDAKDAKSMVWVCEHCANNFVDG